MIEQFVGAAICGFVKVMTAAKVTWTGDASKGSNQCIYFANHRSHADAVLLWSALPSGIRRQTRPVAGADYWLTNSVKRYVAQKVFQCVLIDRERSENGPDPIVQMMDALDAGASLIIFPEGTRNLEEGVKPFKSGLYHLAKARPQVELVPVWLENMGRVMPKGAVIPVPLICTLNFGTSMCLEMDESKEDFLARARQALLGLERGTEVKV